MTISELRGAYPAERAAALAGVPLSTLHYWARNEILVPSVSPTKVKFWSYTDLMGLRTIYWLRQRKITTEGSQVPATTMPAVRRALNFLKQLDLELWTEEGGPTVKVDPGGRILVELVPGQVETAQGERPLDPEMLDLIAPFATRSANGPDLQRPRQHLRIVPGKLSGSPHIAHTRLETVTVAALRMRGFGQDKVEQLYPKVAPIGLVEAVDLERQLNRNLQAAA
jgi:uncharacterized protein (DUF433 family)